LSLPEAPATPAIPENFNWLDRFLTPVSMDSKVCWADAALAGVPYKKPGLALFWAFAKPLGPA